MKANGNAASGESGEGQLLFVVGLPRSGTSLLYALLNQHRRIALMYEADILALPGLSLATKFRTNWITRIELWNGALSRHSFDITPEFRREVTCARGLYHAYSARKYRRKITDAQSLSLAFAARKQATVHGEKSPNYGVSIKHLSKSFPDARFIVIRRDFAEIYRSAVDAGRYSSHFSKAGMWPRLILKQEKLIRETLWLREHGVPVHVVQYRELVEKTEPVAREICAFLDLPFDERMATLKDADLSAVYGGALHTHLREREIRARPAQLELDPKVAERIGKWKNRWRRIETGARRDQPEPSPLDAGCSLATGKLVFIWFDIVRIVYEFLPVSCLRFYRTLKSSFAGHELNVPESSELASLISIRSAKHSVLTSLLPMLVCLLTLAVIGFAHQRAGPYILMVPFYLIPPTVAVWSYNMRAGIIVSFLSSIVWSCIPLAAHLPPHSVALQLWNLLMRFGQISLFIVIFGQWLLRKSAMPKINGTTAKSIPQSAPRSTQRL